MDSLPVIFQGTFDPFTSGHLAVLKDALAVFGRVRVLLLVNPDKKPLFSLRERREMIVAVTADLPGVSVDASDGLLVDYMRAHGLRRCVRGVRNGADAEYELKNHRLSQALYAELQTVLLPCPAEWKDISSSSVKAACARGRVPRGWAPPPVREKLAEKYPGVQFF